MNDARVKKHPGAVHLWLAYLFFFSREQKQGTDLVLIIC
jgi:hypothetical protein